MIFVVLSDFDFFSLSILSCILRHMPICNIQFEILFNAFHTYLMVAKSAWAWEKMWENRRNTCLPIIYYSSFVPFVNWWIFDSIQCKSYMGIAEAPSIYNVNYGLFFRLISGISQYCLSLGKLPLMMIEYTYRH